MTEAALAREAFLVLGAVAWADGTLDEAEKQAILRVAGVNGLSAAELQSLDTQLSTKLELEDVNIEVLSTRDRLYIYATAAWIASADGTVAARERSMLDVLAYHLRLTRKGRELMDTFVDELLKELKDKTKLDLARLDAQIRARLQSQSSTGS